MLQDFIERLRLRKTSEEVIRLSGGRPMHGSTFAPADGALPERVIEIAYLALNAPDATSYSEWSGIITGLAQAMGGLVETLLPVAVVSFGAITHAQPGARVDFVTAVQLQLPESVAIVHGSILASVGTFGSSRLCTFGFWWKGLPAALQLLAALAPGQARELPPYLAPEETPEP